MLKTFDLFGIKINVTNIDSACETIGNWLRAKQKSYVCIAPVSTIMDCRADEKYKEVVNNSSMTTPDGMPIVWMGKAKGFKEIMRTYGPDLMNALCDKGQEKGYKHYFYGGTKETSELLEAGLKRKYPLIKIAGKYAPPFREIHTLENDEVLSDINNSGADILWVGLGSPKQDFWMAEHREKLNVPVLIGVGAAFDFISGAKKQAPVWMRKSGLEWFFRLMYEPKRLWKRYLIGNTKFILLLIKELFLSLFARVTRGRKNV